MGFFLAVKAKRGAAVACHVQRLPLQVYTAFHSKLTVWRRAPLKHVVIFHKRPKPEAFVPLPVFLTGHLIDYSCWNLHFRMMLRSGSSSSGLRMSIMSNPLTSFNGSFLMQRLTILKEAPMGASSHRESSRGSLAHMNFAFWHRAAQSKRSGPIAYCFSHIAPVAFLAEIVLARRRAHR